MTAGRTASLAARLALGLLALGCGGGGGGTGPPPGTLVRVILTPDTITLLAGISKQFIAVGKLSDSSIAAIPVTYTASAGAISTAGVYATPNTPGTYRVTATAQSQTSLKDSSTVTVVSSPPPGSYSTVRSQDWATYASDAQLMSAGLFSWGTSGSAGPIDNFVDLVPDATFGQVVRITQPQDPNQGYSPQMHSTLPTPLDRTWFRFRMRFSVGWTAVGSNGISLSDAYKVAHLYMPGGGATGRTKIEIENATHFDFGFGFPNRSFTETLLAGNTWGAAGSSPMTTEESDGQWYEFIMYHEKTGVLTGQVRAWRRRLTTADTIVDNPFVFVGWTYVGAAATDTFPKISSLALGINKNRSNDQTQYIYWGPWEVVDGSLYPNPWGVGP